MAKRTAARRAKSSDGVNPRQPCPCGSGKRYKACHGAAGGAADVIVTRPFEGLAAECELVALREFVPSATAPLPLAKPGDRQVTLATVLPMAAAGLVRADGTALVGLQVQTKSGDISRDAARAVNWALTAEPGDALPVVGPAGPEDQVRLQDLLDPHASLDVTLHEDFSWWLPGDVEPTGEVAMSLERANAAIMPTQRLEAEGVVAAYWVDTRDKAHLRWVRPEPEEKLLAAMARLAARGELALGEDSRYVGSFRAHGLLVPVWDLDRERHHREWAEPAAALGRRIDEAVASLDDEALTEAERRAREGLRGRQITVR
ncbi:hypothetical protein GCM10012275_53700 [Longimycelium tulufanense]|uniref:DUF5926 domain-containing protein n=1 Tax=Longimycelium tulufanense TaxID=907463 RepID=A0A8J3CH16_9PSEU|nr:DUF5926 family protein [Longimycelium tulufanense]GGM76197.1 hypothetical protein GCM10012275_53700 [Longimycelium tulufanense]